MTSKQYEELCRLFIARQFNIDVDSIKSGHVPSPTLPENPDLKHQIDLYWETGNNAVKYVNIANAKWRTNSKIGQGDVQLLNGVKEQIKAHKAVMITNFGFTSGAIAVAKSAGISLHTVRPDFDYESLDKKDTKLIHKQILEIEETQKHPVFTFQIEHRDLNPRHVTKPIFQTAAIPKTYETRDFPTKHPNVVSRPGLMQKTERGFNSPLRNGDQFKKR